MREGVVILEFSFSSNVFWYPLYTSYVSWCIAFFIFIVFPCLLMYMKKI